MFLQTQKIATSPLVVSLRRINLLHIFTILAIGFILTLPAILYGPFEAHDLILCHLKWSKYFSEQLWSGDFYPRWLLKMNAGLGSPTFFFYPPIPYYFTSLFHLLFTNDPHGWYQLSLSSSLSLIASGLTAYLWLQTVTSRNSALIASIIYMALPYHLAVDLYWRFAFAEYWTFVWLPLILYFSKKIITGNKLNFIGLAVSYALLVMTHLPTLLMFFPVSVGYIFFLSPRKQREKAFILTILATFLGLGLSAIYWLPAMTTQKSVFMDALKQGQVFYGNNFYIFEYKEDWTYVGVLTLTMGVLSYCTFIVARSHLKGGFRRESNYWIIIATISLFMMLPISRPLWDVLPAIKMVQFPWRFNTVLTVACTALLALSLFPDDFPIKQANKKELSIGILLVASMVLAGLQAMNSLAKLEFSWQFKTVFILISTILIILMMYIAKSFNRVNKKELILKILIVASGLLLGIQLLEFLSKLGVSWRANSVVLLVVTMLAALTISCFRKPVDFFQQKTVIITILLVTSLLLSSGMVIETRLYRESNVDEALKISRDAWEYRPRWVPEEVFQPDNISQLSRKYPKAQVTVGQSNIQIQQWQPRKISLHVDATTDIWLTLKQFYYPGWTARLEGESILLPVQPSKSEGLLQISVPSGKHSLKVTLDSRVEERTGQIISAVSVFVALLSILVFSTASPKSTKKNLSSS